MKKNIIICLIIVLFLLPELIIAMIQKTEAEKPMQNVQTLSQVQHSQINEKQVPPLPKPTPKPVPNPKPFPHPKPLPNPIPKPIPPPIPAPVPNPVPHTLK